MEADLSSFEFSDYALPFASTHTQSRSGRLCHLVPARYEHRFQYFIRFKICLRSHGLGWLSVAVSSGDRPSPMVSDQKGGRIGPTRLPTIQEPVRD